MLEFPLYQFLKDASYQDSEEVMSGFLEYVSAQGIEQNSELIAATLQELVFGELFETRYDPLLREGVVLGSATFQPAYFEVDNGYLLIGLAPRETTVSASQAKR